MNEYIFTTTNWRISFNLNIQSIPPVDCMKFNILAKSSFYSYSQRSPALLIKNTKELFFQSSVNGASSYSLKYNATLNQVGTCYYKSQWYPNNYWIYRVSPKK